jgi:hypothetical protein
MKRLLALTLLLASLAFAGGPNASEVVMLACAGADVASSAGRVEANPVLGRGAFGARQVAVKSGILGVWWLATRRHRDRRAVRAGNWILAAAGCGAAVVNVRTR